jgi:hypothetical protein
MATVLRSIVGLVATLLWASPSFAVWVSIKNDTDKTVVVQEVTTVNGKDVRGKEYRLAPGEVLKEFHTQAGTKTVLVAEKDAATVSKFKLIWGQADAAYSVSKSGTDLKVAAPPK